jgi:hypothetical protein
LVKVIITRPTPGVSIAREPLKPGDTAEAAMIAEDLLAQQRTNEIFLLIGDPGLAESRDPGSLASQLNDSWRASVLYVTLGIA